MVKLVFCVRRRSDLTAESFSRRWLDVHGPLVARLREKLPAMKRYVQSHTIHGAPSEALRASRGAKPPYDGITEVWFESLEALGASGPDARLFDQYDNDGYSLSVAPRGDGSLELFVRVSGKPLESRAPFPVAGPRDQALAPSPERAELAVETDATPARIG